MQIMKRIITLISLAFVAASFSAFAQNTEVLEQARQQVQEKQDVLDDAERAHRQQQAESRRNINAAERQIDAGKANVEQSKKRIQAMKEDIKAREAELKLKKQALKLQKESLKLDGKLDAADKAQLKLAENDNKALERGLKDAKRLLKEEESRMKASQKAISSIENDYEFRDSLIWLDSNTVLADYPIFEYRLRRLADLMGKMSIRYSRLEQQRIEAEKEAARQRAIEEARRQQEERNRIAGDLRSNIELHHRAIIEKCDGAGITDKVKLKELKDLYYSYLMVYNKYDLSTGNATNESIAKLDELNAFQNDMLENVLGNNSLPFQIENFKNVLKVRCEKENSDVYRSYTKVFKHTAVPVSFADVREYEEYINRMHTVINVQQRYMQTIDLRSSIASGTDAINNQYGKKYRAVTGSYREVLKGLNQVPAFTTNAESLLFIQSLEDFVAAQQLYIDYARGDKPALRLHHEARHRQPQAVRCGCGLSRD